MSIFNFWKKPLTPAEIAQNIKDKNAETENRINAKILEIVEFIKETGETIGTVKQSIVQRGGRDELQLTISIHSKDILIYGLTPCSYFFMIHSIDPATEAWGSLLTYHGPSSMSHIKDSIVQEIGEVYSRYI